MIHSLSAHARSGSGTRRGNSGITLMRQTALPYFLLLIIFLMSSCGNDSTSPNGEQDFSSKQIAVWRGGEAVPSWVDVYRSGWTKIFIGNHTADPDTIVLLNGPEKELINAMENEFADYLSSYPMDVCAYDGDFTYRVILTGSVTDTTWTCGYNHPALPKSLSDGLEMISGLINESL